MVTYASFIGCISLVLISSCTCADIIYKYTNALQLVWMDAGSSADMDVSIWRIINNEENFCSLGDIAYRSWNRPSIKGILVSGPQSVLVHPNYFRQVWNSYGTGARMRAFSYKMYAPSGFTCLGDAVTNSWRRPDATKYCCVKNDYLTGGAVKRVWEYSARRDIVIWQTVKSSMYPNGIAGGNFLSSGGPRPVGVLLKASDQVREVQ